MKYLKFLWVLLIPFFLIAQETHKKAYDPWYTGPLLAASANNIEKGKFNIQPYLFFRNTHGVYNKKWGHHTTPDTFTFTTEALFQMGFTSWLDLTIGARSMYKKREGLDSFDIGDTSASFGFQIIREKDFTIQPSIRFKAAIFFPTGKYNNLNPRKQGIESSGSGAYEGVFSLNFSKVVYWFENHPIAWRLNPSYTISSNVSVKNFNTYGGGYNTRGIVSPGNLLSLDLSFEYSFTQRWVFAMDFAYIETTKTKFRGTPGTTPEGGVANNTQPSTWRLSLAPALEYNFSKNLGVLGGFHFSVAGKNSTEYLAGIISATYTF